MTPGSTFGDYKVVRLLGMGGMGEVWLLEGKSGNQVAAKILDAGADHESRKRFLREAQLALGVKHPNLVETYDVGEDPESGLYYILMEYVPGGTLADYIKANGALAIEDAVAVVEAIAGVLELGRQKGIVHRDIKPANIMFDAEGTPKLADLGIARAGAAGTETTTVTQTGAMIGTPAYMSPEQMLDSHNVDTRADIYSLGVVFFEMLTGERPNKDDTIVQLMAKAMKGEPLPDVRTLRPEVSASLAQLLNMMVAPDKDGRISTPGQITNALAIIERGGELVDATSSSRYVGEASLPRQNKDGSVQFRRGADAASTGARQDASPTGWTVAPRPPDSSHSGFPKWLIPVLVLAALAGAFFVFTPKKQRVAAHPIVTTNVVERIVENGRHDDPVLRVVTNVIVREITSEYVQTKVVDPAIVRTNVVERTVPKPNTVVNGGPSSAGYQSQAPYQLKRISELELNFQRCLNDLGSKRKDGQRRGVMVFGTLKVDGINSGKDIASWAWLGKDGWFCADVWPSEYDINGGAYVKEGRRILFLKHGYEPLELDFSREARRTWTADEAYDVGVLELKRLKPERQCTLTLSVKLPNAVHAADVRVFLSNRRICGYDWSIKSNLQTPKIEVLNRRVRSGAQLSIDGCTPTIYEISLSAVGCADFKKEIDLFNPTRRHFEAIDVQPIRSANFALRPFSGGQWESHAVWVDNRQSLSFKIGSARQELRLDPYADIKGLYVSTSHGGSLYEDYGELTTEMFDRQMKNGSLARPISLPLNAGKVMFYPGRVYRIRNSWFPHDTLIAFRGFSAPSKISGSGTEIRQNRSNKMVASADCPDDCGAASGRKVVRGDTEEPSKKTPVRTKSVEPDVKVDWGRLPSVKTREEVMTRLKTARVAFLSFKSADTLCDAIGFLRRELGLNFYLQTGESGVPQMQVLTASDLTGKEALQLVCATVDYKYELHDNIIVVFPKGVWTKDGGNHFEWSPVPSGRVARILCETRLPELALTPSSSIIDLVGILSPATRRDPDQGKWVNWALQTKQGLPPPALPEMAFREVSVWDALDLVCRGCEMEFVIDGKTVVVRPIAVKAGYEKARDGAIRMKSRLTPSQIKQMYSPDGWSAMRKSVDVMFPDWRMCDRLKKDLPQPVRKARSATKIGLGYRGVWDGVGDVLATCGNGDVLETRERKTLNKGNVLKFQVQAPSGTRIDLKGIGSQRPLEKTVLRSKGTGMQEVVVDLSEYADCQLRLVLAVEASGFGADPDRPETVKWANLELK